MKKIYKTFITLFLILLILIPVGYFLIFPIYTDLKISLEKIDLERYAQETTLQLLTTISPYKTEYDKDSVLGATTIEESLRDKQVVLDRKILEELNMELVINDIHVDGYIFQGETSETMDEGFWHFPLSAYPGNKGNAVIIGHRFKYLPPNPNTFYNLDKLTVGDEITIKHDEGEYTYIVVDTHIAEANDTSVLEETDDYRLTLITCTPLWTSEKRLVITAKLDKLYKKV
jgi:sortase A